jgi:hypothetical protein
MTGVDRIKDIEIFVPQRITALSESLQTNHRRFLCLVAHLDQLLEGVPYSFVGSASLLLGLGEKYQRSIHDIDIVVHRQDVERAQKVLQENSFDFWEENFIHRNVRNLSGGKGRHHNYAASSPEHLHPTGFLVWIGLFFYQEEGAYLIFTEYLAVSERKIRLMLKDILTRIERTRLLRLEPPLKNVLEAERLDKSRVVELINTLAIHGIEFWMEINASRVNNLDLWYRDAYRALEKRYHEVKNPEERMRWRDYTEPYLEFKLATQYPISAKEYLFSQIVTLPNGRVVFIVPLEISHLIFSEFYPHYLGEREKYREASTILRASGNLNPEKLASFRKVFARREEKYELVDEFDFEMGSDKTMDPSVLRGISENGKRTLGRGEPNYLALLLEGVHYTIA